MSYEFIDLGAVEALTEIPKNANALVEIDGDIKRVPGGALGGSSLLTIKETSDADGNTVVIANMTYDEMKALLDAGEFIPGYAMERYESDSGNFGYYCRLLEHFFVSEDYISPETSNGRMYIFHSDGSIEATWRD
jgi:hypothetical protein